MIGEIMQYSVIRPFSDSTDNGRFYQIGDKYPAEGVKATKARINSLLNGTNKNGKVYLEKEDLSPEE